MPYRLKLYLLLLCVSGFMTISLGIYTLIKHRHAKGAISFNISMLIVTLWSISNALEMSAVVLDIKLFWANIQYIAYCFSPVTLFVLCLEFSGYEKYVNIKKLFWLLIIPLITIILVWTDRYHGLIRYNIHMDYNGAFPVIGKQYGFFFYVHAIYSHGLNLATFFVLLRAVLIRNTIYRKQAMALLLGASLIFIPNLLYITKISPFTGYDITPVFFGPAGIIMAWSIFRYRMFDLVPLARATVIENMEAGVMVLDLQDRILDINPAFADMLGLPIEQIGSLHIRNVESHIQELVKAIIDGSIPRTEFDINRPEGKVIYEALISKLNDRKGNEVGRLVVIHDITKKKLMEKEYYDRQWKQVVRDERNRMVRDLHDNLGQVLGYINLQAQAIQKELIDAHEYSFSNKLDKLIEVAQTAHRQIREYIHDIRNSDLIEIDFVAALNKEVVNYELQTAINVTRRITPQFRNAIIDPLVRIHILNIIKETLNNIRKHSDAEKVILTCDYVEGNILVRVDDDGKGFDVEKTDINQGFGLNIIRERTVEMEGKIEIISQPGKGSSIILMVPIDRRESHAL